MTMTIKQKLKQFSEEETI